MLVLKYVHRAEGRCGKKCRTGSGKMCTVMFDTLL
jgi:hypothetical protein